ncbi:MAG: hypothetical protein KME43_00900 [Myxacorys chilensis ATA2-1-KO14]|nr:hypothetical protein [Myxacorys chilensis ATA2-1-KO14]
MFLTLRNTNGLYEGLPSTPTLERIPMLSGFYKTQFPVWQYLNQPLFHQAYPLILNPKRFWHHYRVELLERCLVTRWKSQKSCE